MSNLLGYAASCAVLATFLMRTMTPLRLVAILSNVLFLAYGYLEHIYPVMFLHLALLPVNFWRLFALQNGSGVLQQGVRAPNGPATAASPQAVWFVMGLLAGVAGLLIAIFVENGGHM